MKVSFDLDGMLFQHWNFLFQLISGMKATGMEVGVMSCHPPEHYPQLSGYDFWYASPDCSCHELECDNKADIMIRENIDVAFDDKGMLIYKRLQELGHPEKIVFSSWSVFWTDIIKLM